VSLLLGSYLLGVSSWQVESLYQDCTVEVFGSERTRVYLPGSDVDLTVITPRDLPLQRIRGRLYDIAEVRRPGDADRLVSWGGFLVGVSDDVLHDG
jgi:predicted nucleotidyltransferase